MNDTAHGKTHGNRKALRRGVAVGVFGLLAVVTLGGLLLVYSGAFNVAATEEHAAFTRWVLDTTMQRSVEHRAPDVRRAEDVTPAMLAAGASAYRSMCQHCHAGPGAEREDWADGMRPRPPHLVETAADWKRNEVFWLVKHGVKMSGMPAFGPTHDDEALWGIAAFVKQLPAMTPERYAALSGGSGASGGSGSGHHGSAGHGPGR